MTDLQTPSSKQKALGKGLGALIPSGFLQEASLEGRSEQLKWLSLDQVLPQKGQPRKIFNDKALEELALSIKTHGVLQPLVVRPLASGKYEVVAGERRLRACEKLGLKEVPCFINPLDERDVLSVALVENLQREDLTPLEEAETYQKLLQNLNLTQEEVAQVVGKDRVTIANALRILKLTPYIQNLLNTKQLTMGHGRALLMFETNELRDQIAKRIIEEDLSVRAVESLAKDQSIATKKHTQKTFKTPSVLEIEIRRQLEQRLATRVELKQKKGKGTILVHFANVEQLNSILQSLDVSL